MGMPDASLINLELRQSFHNCPSGVDSRDKPSTEYAQASTLREAPAGDVRVTWMPPRAGVATIVREDVNALFATKSGFRSDWSE